jgi:hypothetical protein
MNTAIDLDRASAHPERAASEEFVITVASLDQSGQEHFSTIRTTIQIGSPELSYGTVDLAIKTGMVLIGHKVIHIQVTKEMARLVHGHQPPRLRLV